jgi:transcriptional regulator GlxA family with amidase domain
MLSITPAIRLGGFRQFNLNAQPGIEFGELAEVLLLGRDDVAPVRLLFAKLVLHSLLQHLDDPGALKGIDHAQSPAPKHVRQAEDYIKGHLSERLGSIMLAGIVKVSPRSLHRGFVNFRGVTPARYIQDVRLAVAHGLLMNVEGPFDIREIALRTGFKSYPAFWRSFVKKFGVAPSRLRSPRRDT